MRKIMFLLLLSFFVLPSNISADNVEEGEKVEVTKNSGDSPVRTTVRRAPARIMSVPSVYLLRSQMSLVFVQGDSEDDFPYYIL